MSNVREARRGTRVPLKISIAARGVAEPLTCDGETIVVNRHGARISCTVPLQMELEIEITVVITGKRANAKVVYIDPERPFACGIALEKAGNIWGVSLPPEDWRDEDHES